VKPIKPMVAGKKPPTVVAPVPVLTFPPRDQTLQILTRILAENESLEDALEEWSDRLDARGKAWVWDVCQTLFRFRGGIDTLIDQHALKKKPTGRVRKQLWIAVVQILFHKDVSPEKIVHETVDWVKRDSGVAASGFINACLRKIAAEKESWIQYLAGDFPGILPDWWTTELKKVYRDDWIRGFARASLGQPTTWFRAKKGAETPREFFEPGPIDRSFSWKGELAHLTSYARKNEFLVQDLASQILISENLQEVRKYFSEPRLLDRCAAPGGKSVALSWSGVDVFAYDAHEKRRLSLAATVKEKAADVKIVNDEQQFPKRPEWIWVDAPCSGSGVVRRHPEMKWLKNPKDLESLLKIQKELIADSWERLPPGGFLTYTVCSLFPSEGVLMIKRAGLSEYAVKEWTLAPHLETSTDGFYGALLRKPE
jgi:16S rRNA (cytosine967-C5)-methyltransferase